MLEQITPLILTWNEQPNLQRVLARLVWARRVVVLDSYSSDATLEIARSFGNVEVYSRSFDSHSAQWNHGLTHCGIDTTWVLALDADYLVPEALVSEMASLTPAEKDSGFQARFRYCVHGKPLSGSLYPPVTVLYRRERATYGQDGHTQRLRLNGEVQALLARIDHDDRKPLSRWLNSQEKYASLEADMLLGAHWSSLRWQDRLRTLLVVTPWLAPLYSLTVGRGIFHGRAGVYYALQRAVAEAVLSLKLIEARWLHPKMDDNE